MTTIRPRGLTPSRPGRAGRCVAARLLLALLMLGALLGSGCAWLDERLRIAVFRPSSDVPAAFTGLAPGDERLRVPAGNPRPDDQWVEMWWMPAADPGAPTLLYLHGTFRNLHHNHPKMQAIREAGFSVLGVEYRGWGNSSPLVPSEASIHADAELGWRELVRRQPDPALRVIYGHSMGAAAAVELAARRSETSGAADFGGLILESAFNRATDVATAASFLATPVGWFGGLGFESQARIGSVRAPVLMLHGSADDTVPIALGRRLFDAAPAPRAFVAFEGGSHSRLHTDAAERYRGVLATFAARVRSGR